MAYDKNNPFPARLVDRRRLSSAASQKDTQHFSVSLAGSGLTYKCGDSLGVFPTNNPAAVAALLKAAGFTGDEAVTIPKDPRADRDPRGVGEARGAERTDLQVRAAAP